MKMVGFSFSTFAVWIILTLKIGAASFKTKPKISDPNVVKEKPSNFILALEYSVIIELNCITYRSQN